MLDLVRIVYPETRNVRRETLVEWACDAVANGDTSIEATEAALRNDFALVVSVLHDSGYATVPKQ